MRRILSFLLFIACSSSSLYGQFAWHGTQTTDTQAIISYNSGFSGACTLQAADMNRGIAISSATGSGTTVTVTTKTPHGLLTNDIVYIEGASVSAWNSQFFTITVASIGSSTFTFASSTSGTSTTGNIGVMPLDLRPDLFTNANLDSRTWNTSNNRERQFVVGFRSSPFGLDNNRHSRALQAASRHVDYLTCNGVTTHLSDFQTQNIPAGETHNEGVPTDISNPGQYALPTLYWANLPETTIDPLKGIRTRRASAPMDTTSSSTAFVTAFSSVGWSNANGPLTSGTATYTPGSCTPAASCTLFLRADGFSIPGGATYTSNANSFDSYKATVTGASTTGTGNIFACITVDGVKCDTPSINYALTGSSATYVFGTLSLMDFWQGAGHQPPISGVDASTVSGGAGAATYNSSTKVLTANTCGPAQTYCGYPFSTKWTAGSLITVGSSVCTIASVQSEAQITMSSCAASNGTNTYTANNFGVLIWCTNPTGTCSIGPTTYVYNTASNAGFGAFATSPTSPLVTYGGELGYFYFAANELFWVLADGTATYDLGLALTEAINSPNNSACGPTQAASGYSWDQTIPGNFICGMDWFSGAPPAHNYRVTSWQYTGSAHVNRPNQKILDCSDAGPPSPCFAFADLSGDITSSAPTFNTICNARFSALSTWVNEGLGGQYLSILSYPQQNSFGCIYIYQLDALNPHVAVTLIAASPTYYTYPFCWCSVHDAGPPTADGWVGFGDGEGNIVNDTYNVTVAGGGLTTTPGITCPTNTFGAPTSGNRCDNLTITGDPINSSSATIRSIVAGDVMGIVGYQENMQVLSTSSSTTMVVWRGYLGTAPQNHPASSTMTMLCGNNNVFSVVNQAVGSQGIWNFLADPLGANAGGTTLITDPLYLGGHQNAIGSQPEQPVLFGAGVYLPLCPLSGDYCGQTRPGTYTQAIRNGNVQGAVSVCPPFAGKRGVGCPNPTDTHAGPAFGNFIMDSRPFTNDSGGPIFSSPKTVANNSTPFIQQTTTPCWLLTAATAANLLNPKFLFTMAYVGKVPLVDVSGPNSASTFGCTSANNYEYCLVSIAGECQSGSSVGDLWVNTPYVSYGYCWANDIAVQGDDINSICIGDLGAFTANVVQNGWVQNDLWGFSFRSLGTDGMIWNFGDVFANANATPTGTIVGTRPRWLNYVRGEVTMQNVPPFPAPDGVNRGTFVSQAANVPTVASTSTAEVEFWYAEIGNGSGCTSRQEACKAVTTSVNLTTPFYWASETYSRLSCASGCSIAIPALSQHVLYWRPKYYNSGGTLISTGSTVAVAVP